MKRLAYQPFELGYALMCFVTGALILGSGLRLQVSVVQALPASLVVGWALALLLGGALTVVGLARRWALPLGYGIERAGLRLAGSSWIVYLFMLAVSDHRQTVLPYLWGTAFLLGTAGRLFHITREEAAL